MSAVYSEMMLATVLRQAPYRATTGAEIDAGRTRPVVTVGALLGPLLGCAALDSAVAWVATRRGEEAPLGARAALHLMPDGRCALGLGATRGMIESAGDRLVVLTRFEPARYASAWYLPGVLYGGLL